MQDNPLIKQCGVCRQDIPVDKANTKNWALKEIIDYKKRAFSAPGFPYSGTVSVEGWRLQEFDAPETVLCPHCIDKRLEELKDAVVRSAHNAKLVAMVTGGIGLILTVLSIGYALIDPAFDWSEPPYSLFVIPAGIALAVSVIAFLLHRYPDKPGDPAKELHWELMESEVKNRSGAADGNVNLVRMGMLNSDCGRGSIIIDEGERPADYLSCEDWDIVTAMWKTNSPAPAPPNSYPRSYLEESLNNMGFKNPSEFLAAGEHGEIV